MIKEATVNDLSQIVRMHIKELAGDFLPSLGEKFLTTLYKDLQKEEETIILVTKNADIKGFILGATNFSKLFNKIIKKNFLKYSYLLITSIMKKPLLFKNIVSSLFYSQKTNKSRIKPELVVISVEKKFQNKDLGTLLIVNLEREFKKRGIKRYKVSTTAKNIISNNFYIKNNFSFESSFSLYNKDWNLYSKSI